MCHPRGTAGALLAELRGAEPCGCGCGGAHLVLPPTGNSTPEETLALLIRAGLFDTAITLCQTFKLPLTAVFEGLTFKYVASSCLGLCLWLPETLSALLPVFQVHQAAAGRGGSTGRGLGVAGIKPALGAGYHQGIQVDPQLWGRGTEERLLSPKGRSLKSCGRPEAAKILHGGCVEGPRWL